MLIGLIIGSLAITVNLAIQVLALVIVIRFVVRRLERESSRPGILTDLGMVSIVLSVLLAGHLMQFATWALLFMALGEFGDLQTAYYHSVVNFTSLGYGDIVMSPRWRLLGALEAANGVLMFGVTTGGLMAVMSQLFVRHTDHPQRQDETAP